jgi:peptidoglycan/LPS O-acetylase OafA/YrhL
MTVIRPRFEVLDSFRGICACLVCLYHFEGTGFISESKFVRQSWMFVDFFFVLSGFVIAHSYFVKLNRAQDLVNFFTLRFARIYPLHLLMLLLMIAFESARLCFLRDGSNAFQTESRSIFAIFTNIFQIQSLNLHSTGTWNAPSWSISAEWWAYSVFALVCVLFSNAKRLLVFVSFSIGIPILFYFVLHSGLNVIYDFGFLRCLYGFSFGVLAFAMRGWINQFKFSSQSSAVWGAICEPLVLFGAVLFVIYSGEGPLSLLAPFVFFMVVLVFSFESAKIARCFKVPLLKWLGMLSFSIYMVHWLIHTFVYLGLDVAVRLGLPSLWVVAIDATGKVTRTVGRDSFEGLIAHVVVLGICIGVSYLTYRYVEMPGRRLGKIWVTKRVA